MRLIPIYFEVSKIVFTKKLERLHMSHVCIRCRSCADDPVMNSSCAYYAALFLIVFCHSFVLFLVTLH